MPLLDPFCIDLEVEPYSIWVTAKATDDAVDYFLPSMTEDPRTIEDAVLRQQTIAMLVGDYFTGDQTQGIYHDDKNEYGYTTTENPDGHWDYYQFNKDHWRRMYLKDSFMTATLRRNFPDYINNAAIPNTSSVGRVDNIDFAKTRTSNDLALPMAIVWKGKYITLDSDSYYSADTDMWESIYYDQIIANLESKNWILLYDIHG